MGKPARQFKHCRRDARYISIVTLFVPGLQELIDTMRYERLSPAEERDSYKLISITNGRAEGADNFVRFVRCAPSDQPISAERCRSFGIVVLDERPADEASMSDAEALQRLQAMRAGVSHKGVF